MQDNPFADLIPKNTDPYQPRRTVRVPAESTGTRATTRNATPEQVAANRAANWQMAKGLGRQAGQGLTFGGWDELEGGVTSLVTGEPYKAARDRVRQEDAQFQEEHPGLALGANLVGGVASGAGFVKAATKVPALAKVGLAAAAKPTATAAQRLGAAVKTGAAGGTLAGVGLAPEIEDVPLYAAGSGVAGAVAGGVLAGGSEILRNFRNVAGQVGQQGDKQNVIRRMIQSEAPDEAAARRVLAILGRTNTSLDDLAKASASAERPTALAELLPDDEGVRGLRIARNVGRKGGMIDRSLSERAADEPARYAEAIVRNTGVPEGLDAKTFANKALGKVQARVDDLYEKAYTRPDVSAAPILGSIEKLSRLERGRMALKRAGELADGFDSLQNIDPANPMISVRNLHNLRQGLDRAIAVAEQEGDEQMVRVLTGERRTIDRAFKLAGGKLARRADRLWESASSSGESFALGQRAQNAQTKGGLVRMKSEARDPEAFRQGAASKQLERVEGVQDGLAGQIRNPTVGTMGSPIARAKSSLGYRNATEFGNARGEAERIVERLRTRQAVSGNSTTARNLAEMTDEFMGDPNAVAGAMLTPSSMPKMVIERILRGGAQGLSASQADEMGRILGAGLPGQMSREQALAMLNRMAPEIQKHLVRQLVVRNAGQRAITGRAGAAR